MTGLVLTRQTVDLPGRTGRCRFGRWFVRLGRSVFAGLFFVCAMSGAGAGPGAEPQSGAVGGADLAWLDLATEDLTAQALATAPGTYANALASGLVYQRQGQHDLAIGALRAAVALDPAAIAPRQALVASLIAVGDRTGALFQLEEARRRDPDADRRARYAALARTLDAARPGDWDLSFAVKPSSNVTAATLNQTVPGPGGSIGTIIQTARPGTEVQAGVTGWRHWTLGSGDLRAEAGLGFRLYDDPILDRADLTAALAFRQQATLGGWGLSAQVQRQVGRPGQQSPFADGTTDQTADLRFGLGADRTVRLSDRMQIALGLDVSRTTHDATVDQPLDGSTVQGSLSLSWQAKPRTGFDLSGTLGRTWAEDPRFSNDSLTIEAGVTHLWPRGARVRLSVRLGWAEYEADFAPSVGYDAPRSDQSARIAVSATTGRALIWGAAPEVTCAVSVTASNIAFYDARNVTECGVALVRRF